MAAVALRGPPAADTSGWRNKATLADSRQHIIVWRNRCL